MNFKPQTYLKAVRYIAPLAWQQYLIDGNAKRISAAQKIKCDAFLAKVEKKGEVHFVISGEKHPNCKIKQKGCRPSMGMNYTLLIKLGAVI